MRARFLFYAFMRQTLPRATSDAPSWILRRSQRRRRQEAKWRLRIKVYSAACGIFAGKSCSWIGSRRFVWADGCREDEDDSCWRLESDIFPFRAWSRLFGTCGGVAYLHALASPRSDAETGMDCGAFGPGRHLRRRHGGVSDATGDRHQRRRKWSGVRSVSHLMDCVLGHCTLPRDGDDGAIRNHQGFDWEADVGFTPAGPFDRLCI